MLVTLAIWFKTWKVKKIGDFWMRVVILRIYFLLHLHVISFLDRRAHIVIIGYEFLLLLLLFPHLVLLLVSKGYNPACIKSHSFLYVFLNAISIVSFNCKVFFALWIFFAEVSFCTSHSWYGLLFGLIVNLSYLFLFLHCERLAN